MTTMALDPGDFAYISSFVRQSSAIVLEPGKEYLVDSRLAPVLREHGLPSISALVGELKRSSGGVLHTRVVEAMTTNETSFFRDVAPFDGMRTQILPDLIQSRSTERRLRIWCGAASSGQEPYSLAMLILEHFPQLAGWDVRIIATDLSREILDRARAGRYSQLEVNRGLPAPMLVKYFERSGTEWSVKAPVRKLVQFEEMNLVRPWKALPASDVVFMRNVLIYFDVPTKRDILARVRTVLRPDGYLFLGSAETTMNIDANFARVSLGKSSCYRIGAP
jgi:chemotaxis protein methyltransferase CheR